MQIPSNYLGISLSEITSTFNKQQTPYATAPFQWKSEYLPIVLGVAGVATVFVIAGIAKKRKKRKRK